MSLALRFVLLLAILIAAPLRFAQAEPVAVCNAYAHKAVVDFKIARNKQCGFSGDAWSDNQSGHFQWCTRATKRQVDHQSQLRTWGLELCESCIYYANAAYDAQKINDRELHCGFSGDRWSYDRGGHFRWCMGATYGQRNREATARDNDLKRCRANRR